MEWQRRVFDLLEGHAAIIATAAAILLGAWLTVRLLSSREAYSNKFEWSHPVEAEYAQSLQRFWKTAHTLSDHFKAGNGLVQFYFGRPFTLIKIRQKWLHMIPRPDICLQASLH